MINLPYLLAITSFWVSARCKCFRGFPVTYSIYQKRALCDIPWLFLSTCFPNRSTQPNNISRLLARGMWCRVLCPRGTKFRRNWLPIYTECPRRNVSDSGRMFLMLKYTDITQNTYAQSWTVTEIMAREVWKCDSCYTLIDYQIHIKTGRNMWFL